MSKGKDVLFLLPDCPGYFTRLCYQLGVELKNKGYHPVFAATTPFYEKFKRVDLSQAGKVYYLDRFLQKNIDRSKYSEYEIDHWSYYASYSRQSYFFKKHLNTIDTLKKTKLFFQQIFEESNIALVFSEIVSNSFLYLAHQQANANKIPFFGLLGARIPYHYNIQIDVVGNEMLINNKAPKEYVPTDAVLDYMKISQFGGLFDRKSSVVKPSFIKELFQFMAIKPVYSLETGHTKSFLLKVYRIALKRILSDFLLRRVYNIFAKDVTVDQKKIYVVYPLHVYPEASTSVFAKYYDGNEYNLIKNLAFSLPVNSVLVVKEHKNNVGTYSKAFYDRIKQLPNVLLLDPYYNLKDNLEKFDAVVTLSSTVGFEALTKNIPVFTLGEVSFQKYPGSVKINSYLELEEHMKNIKKKQSTDKSNETYNIYSKVCFPGSFNYMDGNCLDARNIELLLAPVTEFLSTGNLKTFRNDL